MDYGFNRTINRFTYVNKKSIDIWKLVQYNEVNDKSEVVEVIINEKYLR